MYNLEFGGWELCEVIGEGAFAKVWRAEKELDGTKALSAVKVISVPADEYQLKSLRAEGLSEQETRDFLYSIVKGYLSEIRLMTDLQSCPNIVGIHDCAVHEKENGTGWDILIRMELLTPLDRFAAASPPDENTLVRLGRDICAALGALQQAKPPLVHRDIKPSNIFVSDYGVFKLGDFGAAKEALMPCDSGTRLGCGEYTPPETAYSGEYSAQSDLYSLGLVLYRLANNNLLPFVTDRSSPSQRMEAVNRRFIGEPFPLPSGVSTRMGEVICRACAFRPKDRYASAAEFAAALDSVQHRTHDPQNALSVKNTRSRPPKKALIALPIAAGAVAVGLAAALLVNAGKGAELPASDKLSPDMGTISETADSQATLGSQDTLSPQATLGSQATLGTQEALPETDTPEKADENLPQPAETHVPASVSAATDKTPEEAEDIAPANAKPAASTATTTPKQTTPPKTTATPKQTTATTAQTTASAAQPASQPAEANPADDFATSVSGGQATITGYSGRSRDVVIPAEIDGLPVTAIGDGAFARQTILSVAIPEGVKRLGSSVFDFCPYLESVSLPESLRIIGGNAFYGCSALTELYIPAGVTMIDGLCFGWSGLEAINVAQDNEFYTSVDGVLYTKDMATLVFYPRCRRSTSYTIPEGVVETYIYAIDRPVFLETLTLPTTFRYFNEGRVTGSIRDIRAENNPFLCDIDGVLFSADRSTIIAYPSGRTDADYYIPSGTTTLGTYAFAASSLTRIHVPESVNKVNELAVAMNDRLSAVEYNGASYSASEFMALFGLTTF